MLSNQNYTRLPGRSHRYFGFLFLFEAVFTFGLFCMAERIQLFLGDNHLLVIRRRLFSEELRRFYYRDIQAITIRSTPFARQATWVLTALAFWLMLLALLGRFAGGLGWLPMLVILLLTAGIAVAGLVNFLLGPTCVTELYTPVHRERLFCLGRWNTAQRVIAALEPRIEAVQGRLDTSQWNQEPVTSEDEPLSESERFARTEAAQYTAKPYVRDIDTKPSNTRDDAGNLHALVFVLFLVFAVSSIVDFYAVWKIKDMMDSILTLVLLFLTTIAVARQRENVMPPFLKKFTIACLICLMILSYISQIVFFVNEMLSMADDSTTIGFDSPGSIPRQVVNALSLVTCTILGLLGLLELRRYRKLRSIPQPSVQA